MPNAIYALADNAITALVMALVVGGDVFAALVYRFFSRAWLPPGSTGSILDAFRVVVTLTALVLAFSLVQAQTNLRQTEAILAQEASALDLAQRQLEHFGGELAADLRTRLFQFGNDIVTEEWPLLAHGEHSRRLDGIYTELMRSATELETTTVRQQSAYNDILRTLDRLAYLRNERIIAAAGRLPASFWHAIEVMALISIMLAAAVPATLPHRMCTLLPSAALAVLIALVIIIDVPFQGQSAVRPVELQHVLSQMGQ